MGIIKKGADMKSEARKDMKANNNNNDDNNNNNDNYRYNEQGLLVYGSASSAPQLIGDIVSLLMSRVFLRPRRLA
jgi:hypothetical protein